MIISLHHRLADQAQLKIQFGNSVNLFNTDLFRIFNDILTVYLIVEHEKRPSFLSKLSEFGVSCLKLIRHNKIEWQVFGLQFMAHLFHFLNRWCLCKVENTQIQCLDHRLYLQLPQFVFSDGLILVEFLV